jgi:hypothetical protein
MATEDTAVEEGEEQQGTKPSKKDDDEIIKDCRDYMRHCIDFDGDNRANAVEDLEFGAGDQWPDNIKQARDADRRPCLTNNVLPTYLRQVTGDQRQNKGGIKVHPLDDDADSETAETVQGLIRHIEYESNADVAYDTAVNGAASNGFGYFRLVTEYERADSFNQCIKFKRIRNPLTVYFDPGAEQPDGSDQTKCVISSKIKKEDYKRFYPKADMAGFDALRGNGDWADWCDDLFIRVAEFYRIEYTDATLVMLSNGETGWKDKLVELPEGVTIVKERDGQRKKVCWYKLSAVEVLERTEIKCDWIPVFPVFGDEVDIEGKVIRSGLIRYAKDPMRMYNFWMTTATEEVALRPKTPFIGAEGQFEGHEDTWSQANLRSFAYMEYKPVTIDGTLAPAPQRQAPADVPTGMLAMAMHAYENIQKTIGIYNAGLGAKSNETSGKAIIARQREGDVGTFHFTDNLNISRNHAGRCILSMLPYYYDTERDVRAIGEDGTPKQVTLNQPNISGKKSKDGQVREVLNNLRIGKYDCTVTSGPSYTTLRQETAESMVSLAQAAPQLLDIAGDQMIRNMDWPGAHETADRMKRYIALKTPGIIEPEEGEEGRPADAAWTDAEGKGRGDAGAVRPGAEKRLPAT